LAKAREFFFKVFGLGRYWDFNSGICTCWSGTLQLIHASSPFYSGYFEDKALFLPMRTWRAILIFYASCQSWDDKHVLLCPAIG
jgi:hypothetical protein